MGLKCFMLEPTGEERTTDDGHVTSPLYRRADTGEGFTLNEAPEGAMFYATWLESEARYLGPDGRSLSVKCPDGSIWNIDGQANNCDKKGDHKHKCWCRHGTPPNVTVDKSCETCGAGGGSIQTHNYHGHLVNGEFT